MKFLGAAIASSVLCHGARMVGAAKATAGGERDRLRRAAPPSRTLCDAEVFTVHADDYENEDGTPGGTVNRVDSDDGVRVYDLDVPPSWAVEHAEEMRVLSGSLRISCPCPGGYTVTDGALRCNGNDGPEIVRDGRSRRELATSDITGEKTVLAVRVITNDATENTPDFTLAQLKDSIFGHLGDRVNLKSQYAACSHNQLTFTEATDYGTSDLDPSGVVDISIDLSKTHSIHSEIITAINAAVQAKLGSHVSTLADHVMYCLPPGTTMRGTMYAGRGDRRSVFLNTWCIRPSAQMHEIGHNMRLPHSGELGERYQDYADHSSVMGKSWLSKDTKICFNGPKNWLLGWFSDRHETFGLHNLPWSGNIYGVAEFDSQASNQKLIVKLNTGLVDNYYISFNRNTGINAGTREGKDNVLVHRSAQGDRMTTYEKSWLEAKLGQGGSYNITDFGGSNGTTVQILVDYVGSHATPGYTYATVKIFTRTLSSLTGPPRTTGAPDFEANRSSDY